MKSMRLACIVATVGLAAASWLTAGVPAAEDGGKKAEPPVVKKILEVTYEVQKVNPPNLKVTAVGEVPTGGYGKAELVRAVYATPPEDGIQDYTLVAAPPTGPATQVVSKVSAENLWKDYAKEAPWIKGVRVHGEGKGVVVKMFSESKKS